MLKIRLKRTGRRGQPHYRVVVMESHLPRDGKSVQEIGYYNPRTKPTTFEVDQEAAKIWLEKGAQPSDTIAQYFVKLGLMKSLKRGSVKPNTTKKEKKTE
ncbi:MAG: 30S ribosomal protein S16 [candidate division WS6 bacterium GW2011_GWE1_34_7]|uniref:Small ribosomal subunit protein bS16 n=1 Tax=candidate division WS6 bacterium GW2011_GWE1_34_7 TaxID=1619093 RepID=A0A0G0B859_9BACT|nr:MAG: 30S ribosomal protein S16 [candidate division WS6 bacterium GW2011_GWE1_34_7]